MSPIQPASDSLRPWQFFALGALVCATAAVFIMRGTTAGNLIFVCLAIFSAALVGLAALGALRPLVTGDTRQPEMVGSSTRAAIEREKNLVLRAIKELEFDHAMGKVGEDDYREMVARLRSRAVRLIEQLDHTSSGYRELIERELASRLVKAVGKGDMGSTKVERYDETRDEAYDTRAVPAAGRDFGRATGDAGVCASCATVNDDDAKFCKNCGAKLLSLLLSVFLPFSFFVVLVATPAFAQFEMPDPKQMSGIPRPVTDLPVGHVSVRLIRGQLSNNIQGHPVEIHAGEKVLTVKTDENGRAEFSGVAPGTTVTAAATVEGERLESQEFPWPRDGGIRVMLVATAKGADAPPPVFQPQPGNVVLGDQTRIIIDHTDDALQIYYILDIRNTARAPVQPAKGVVIDMPTGATGATVLEGAPQAVARGDRVTVSGPFKSGQTQVQVAYRMPFDSGDVSVEQTIPLPVAGLAVLMKKVGETSLSSPQLPNVQEREFEGERYVLAQGPALAAGSTLAIAVSGLPHHSPAPRRIALALALVIASGCVWMATRRASPAATASRVKQLTARREKLFGELVRLEQQRRAGGVDPAKYADRRPALLTQLERVYRDLDAEGGQSAVA